MLYHKYYLYMSLPSGHMAFMQRHGIASTLIRRRLDVMCLMGIYLLYAVSFIQSHNVMS